MVYERIFTSKENAKKFMTRLRKDGINSKMTEELYSRKLQTGEWIKYPKWKVQYETSVSSWDC